MGKSLVVVGGTAVIFAIIAVIIFQLPGVDKVEVGPDGVKIETNPEPDKTDVNTVGDKNVVVTGNSNSIVIEANKEKFEKLIQNQELIFEKLGIEPQIDATKEITISPEILQELNDLRTERDNLKINLAQQGEKVTVDVDFLLKESNAFFHAEEYEKMLSLADAALVIEPDNLWVLNNKGLAIDSLAIDSLAIDSLERYEEAIVWYDKALAIDENYVAALNNKGSALYSLGMYEEARTYFEKALEIDPGYDTAKSWLELYN